ncbi:class I adenylate-forming enzyme family protein [Desulfovibrio sp. JC010]|uniref:class I adenylate-forming enzyme family protein n=1 Tax=Desulfovibrio sp. JC010 TaxID=2593641 RepID=UPI0013D282C5|nr:class I adenylate-forming enzyme family protein [Desulfovibrio sp. JC010]NDV27178.1 acyl--CoA ligase [Desulfovibrio sp. JC010]
MSAISKLKDIVDLYSSEVFLIDAASGDEFTYSDIHKKALQLAAKLSGRGLSKGDKLAIMLPNSVDHAVLLIACLSLGIITVPVNRVLTGKEIDTILDEGKISKFIFDTQSADKVAELSADVDVKIVFEDFLVEDFSPKEGAAIKWFDGVHEDDIMTIVFTSGTTGTPKGVAHRIGSLVNNALLFAESNSVGSENRFYNVLSMSYLGGYYNLLLLPFVSGASVVIGEAFSPHSAMDFWSPIIERKVNTLWLVPTIVSIVLEFDRSEAGSSYCKENVKCAFIGTAPLMETVKDGFEEKYGVELLQNYGLSETLWITANKFGAPDNKGVGRILGDIEVQVDGEDSADISRSAEGEILVKSPYLMADYVNTDSVLTDDGFFRTGDLGYFQDGQLFITGRKKDLIIRSGLNISPLAVENVIQKHESVTGCAVVGVPHRINGEDVVAVVSLKEGIQLKEIKSEILDICNAELTSTKVPSVFFQIDNFPMGSSGKIKKNVLKDVVAVKLHESVGDTFIKS